MTLVSPRRNSVVTPTSMKLFKPRHPSSLCGFHPIQLSAFITILNWAPINQHHPEGIPNIQIFYLLYAGVHLIRDYGHPGNLIPQHLPRQWVMQGVKKTIGRNFSHSPIITILNDGFQFLVIRKSSHFRGILIPIIP